jgi:hypothetical protein
VIWVGFDLSRFGYHFHSNGDKFLDKLEWSVASEDILIQETTPLKGPPMPKRALWMSMHGYFGNWYKPEEKKWAVLQKGISDL